jgi:hypothetical protein
VDPVKSRANKIASSIMRDGPGENANSKGRDGVRMTPKTAIPNRKLFFASTFRNFECAWGLICFGSFGSTKLFQSMISMLDSVAVNSDFNRSYEHDFVSSFG